MRRLAAPSCFVLRSRERGFRSVGAVVGEAYIPVDSSPRKHGYRSICIRSLRRIGRHRGRRASINEGGRRVARVLHRRRYLWPRGLIAAI